MAMLRLIWPAPRVPPRNLTEDEFISEFSVLADRDFAGLPPGPVVVEGLDAQYRVAWRAHYKNARGLSQLLRQLCEERDVRLRERAGQSRASKGGSP
jgi:hypothetical protein